MQLDLLRGDYAAVESKLVDSRRVLPRSCLDCAEKLRLIHLEVLTLQGRSRDVLSALSAPNQPDTLDAESKIKEKVFSALAHISLGQLEVAQQELNEAHSLVLANHSPLIGDVLQTTGILEARQGDYSIAEASLSQSLAMARKQNDKKLEASSLLDLGWISLQSEHYGEALDLFSASAAAAKSLDAQALLEIDIGNVGWAYYKLGNYDLALSSFLEAEAKAKKLGAGLSVLGWIKNSGLCRQRLGDDKGAASDYEDALQGAINIGNENLISELHSLVARLYLQENRKSEAKEEADKALLAATLSGNKSAELDARFLQGVVALGTKQYSLAEHQLLALYAESEEYPSLRWDIENALAGAEASMGRVSQADAWYRKSIMTFEMQRSGVKNEELRLPFFANGEELYRSYADFLLASHKSGKALQLLDLGRAKTLSEGLGLASQITTHPQRVAFDPREIARKQKATILFYSLGREKSWLWAINGQQIQRYQLPKKTDIEAMVALHQKAILRSTDLVRDSFGPALELYDVLVAPARSMVKAGSRILIVPDGILTHLNFETLLAPGQPAPHFWIEDVIITDAHSMRLLDAPQPRQSKLKKKNILLIGNPIANGAEYERLPNAPAEVEVIARQFAGTDAKFLTQSEALPSSYGASKPEQFSYIHFVAHGTASELSPLDSAVVLSPAAGDPEKYKLYARDIIHNPIHADLVTISACYSSGVRTLAGEGLVGLTWAFLRAGSRHVIGALWNVDDASTPRLMEDLYSQLMAGAGPDQALRHAKLSLLHSEGVYRKPFYWGAFELYAGS